MRRELIIKSKSLAGTSDLTLLAPIRPGLVASLDTISHKSRIKRLLQTLSAGRSVSQEHALLRPFSDAVERVGKIHSVRVAVLEPQNQVLLAVTFDGSWESYIRVLWQKVGTLLDIIFFDTEDYVSAYDNRFEEWEAWCRRVQVETHFYYGTPELTVDDVRYLKQAEALQRRPPVPKCPVDLEATQLTVSRPEAIAWQAAAETSGQASIETLKQGLEALAAIYRLADFYLPSTEDGLYLHRAARDLLLEFVALLSADEFPPQLLAAANARFEKQLRWLQKPPPPPRNTQRVAPPLPIAFPSFDASDVQGGIVRTYEGTTHGCLMLLAIDDRAAAVAFFARLLSTDGVTTEDHATLLRGDVAVNVAITYEGLRCIGLTEDELAMFPEEFREGMETRASTLGDLRANHPRRWKLPRRFGSAGPEAERVELSAIHVVLQLRVNGERGKNTLSASDGGYVGRPEFKGWRDAIEASGMKLLAVEPMQRNFRGEQIVEHFGFADGGSDPVIDPALRGKVYPNQIHLGELLCGYANEADWPPDPGRARDVGAERKRRRWLDNGTFLVVRKLAQDLPALRAAVPEGELGDRVLAKMMGRNQDGSPLIAAKSSNDFTYEGDPLGTRCPFHAHIRRANPRIVPLGIGEPQGRRMPRLARRGMAYGPPAFEGKPADASERGLVFMAYNASIAEQFETVQRWISGGNSSGGYSGQSDPFMGVPENGARRVFRFVGDDGKVESVDLDGNDDPLGERKPFVRLEWGAYLFTPSITALREMRSRLALGQGLPEPAWSIEEGEQAIQRLLEAGASLDEWKFALEDPIEVEKFRAASIWAAIRKHHGGVLKTPYGVLVADRDHAMQVLRDGPTYSVRGYRDRLAGSIGAIYLGEDEGAAYKLSAPVNHAIMSIDRVEAYELAQATTRGVLAQAIGNARRFAPNPTQSGRWELIIEIKELIDPMLGLVCQEWFGLPVHDPSGNIKLEGSRWDAEPHQALYPGHFTAPSRYVFQPHPGPASEQYGRDYGNTLTSAFTRFIEATAEPGKPWPVSHEGRRPQVMDAIWAQFGDTQPTDFVARTLVGAMMGFLPTVDGNLRRSLNEWLYEGTFWSLRTAWRALAADKRTLEAARDMLMPALVRTMQLRPSPELVWRTATRDHALAGCPVSEGEIVVVSVVSAAQQCLAAGDADDYPMFGGNRKGPSAPTHACPGYEAAMGVMLGFIAALLEVDGSMRPSAVPLALTLEGPVEDPPLPDAAALADEKREGEKNTAALARRVVHAGRGAVAAAAAATGWPAGRAAGSHRPLIIGLGDSWFHYFAIDVFDALERAGEFEVVSLAREGTRLLSLRRNPEQLVRLSHELDAQLRRGLRPGAILLSAGGDDVIRPRLRDFLNPHGTQPALNEKAERFVKGEMRAALEAVIASIDEVCRAVLGNKAGVPIVLHGYAYPYPDGRGPVGAANGGSGWDAWLRPEFELQGYEKKRDPQSNGSLQVMRDLIDMLNEMQHDVAKKSGGQVHHVDLRELFAAGNYADGSYRKYWSNELHPTPEGFASVAEALAAKVRQVVGVGA